MKTGISVVILSKTIDEELYRLNVKCISSLMDSEDWELLGGIDVLLIESNKKSEFTYDERIRVLIPQEEFNFNKFLNIGVDNSYSQYIALCNNDIIFQRDWFSEILKVKINHPYILCFSPIDRDYSTMSYEKFPDTRDYYLGWENKYHFSAWCFVVDRRIFSFIGKFDETFDFYSADDDFLLTLRKYNLDNALVTKSHVKHLSQQVTQKTNKEISPRIKDKSKYPIPEKDLKQGFSWLWDDIRFYEAHFKMKDKWGDLKMINRINRLLGKYPLIRKRVFSQILYNRSVNIVLSKLTGL